MTNEELAAQILKEVGPKENIEEVTHCMTRLRLHLKEESYDAAKLKALQGVLGVNKAGDELQIVLGPGKAAQVTDCFTKLLETQNGSQNADASETTVQAAKKAKVGDGTALHNAIRQKNATPGKLLLRRIASIFMPLIPGFIGCGLLSGIVNILVRYNPALGELPPVKILALAGSTVFWGLNLFVGWNTAKVFGGTPVLGGALGALISLPSLSQITLYGAALQPGRGGIVAVLLVAFLGAQFEKKLHRWVPESLDLFVTPFVVMGVMALAALYVLQPLGGFIAESIGFAATEAVSRGGAVTGFILGGTFLPLVMMGVHQGLTPIHAQLIAQYGYTILLPILAMAGGGQVGAAAAVYMKTKNPEVRKVVASALPVGLLGVGEPLIYGVTLPLGRPFIGACIGGAFGGAVQAACSVGAMTLGISGLPLAASTTQPLAYLAGLVVSYVAGFAATWVLGFEDPKEE
jgi:PTS system sucrose-specific IIC component